MLYKQTVRKLYYRIGKKTSPLGTRIDTQLRVPCLQGDRAHKPPRTKGKWTQFVNRSIHRTYTLHMQHSQAYLNTNHGYIFINLEIITSYNCTSKEAELQCHPMGESRCSYSFITTISFYCWLLKSMTSCTSTCTPTTYFYSTRDTFLWQSAKFYAAIMQVKGQGSHWSHWSASQHSLHSGCAPSFSSSDRRVTAKAPVIFSHFFVSPCNIPDSWNLLFTLHLKLRFTTFNSM